MREQPARVTGLPSSTIETQYSNVIREPRMIGWFPSRQEGNVPRGRGDFFIPAHPSQRGGPRLSQVTVGERILVQLSWYLRFSDAFECPRETTQDGIAEALGISRAHAALELKRLKASARVEERMAHVAGGRTRRKVYFLTSSGAAAARALRDHVRAKPVLLSDRGDRREVLGQQAIEALKARGVRGPEATQLVLKGDLVDARASAGGPSRQLPLSDPFVDREAELEALESWLRSPSPLAIVLGVAGIGKTALAAQAASSWEGPVWYRKVYSFEDARTFAAALGDFLARVDRPRLRNYLASGAFDSIGLGTILREDLTGVLLVVDDLAASPEVAGVLRLAMEDGGGAKVLATARERPALEAGIRGPTEVILAGLPPQAARALVAKLLRGSGDGVDPIVAAGRGHPLALHVLAGADRPSAAAAERLLDDAILEGLDADLERAAVSLAILREPCERPSDLGVSASHVRRLLRRGLLTRGPMGYALHDLAKDILLPKVPAGTLRTAHRAAAREASTRGDAIEEAFHLFEGGKPRAARDVLVRAGPDLLASPSVGVLARLLEPLPMTADATLLRAEALDRLGRGGEATTLLDDVAGDAGHSRRGEAPPLLGRIATWRNALAEATQLSRDAL